MSYINRFAVLTLATAAVCFGQLPSHKVLTLDLALKLAQESLATCRAKGFHVTVRVVDATNMPKVVLHDDDSNNVTVQVGEFKTNYVMAYGRPSPDAGPNSRPVPPIPNVIFAKGGIPIKVDGVLIGAIGVSGATGSDNDALCAQAGLTKYADQLK